MPICSRWGFLNDRYDFIVKPPQWLRNLYPSVLWRAESDKKDKRVFLTFDDGPVPGITSWVVECLKSYEARATFFCVGDNIRKYPSAFMRLKEEKEMETGCHSFSHKPGHRMGKKKFLKDLDKGLEYMPETRWFRPPHGSMYPWWIKDIRRRGIEVVMWDVLSRDYDRSVGPGRVLRNVTANVRPGSVIVFHDSLRAWPNLKVSLPRVLTWLKENGYRTEILGSIDQ